MTVYVCIKDYSFEQNDGNGDMKVFIFEGQMFYFRSFNSGIWDLPGNFNSDYDDNFEKVQL